MASATQPLMGATLRITAFALLAIALGLTLGAWLASRTAVPAPARYEPKPETRFTTVDAFPNLSFDSPVEFTHAGDNSGRYFVLEQRGVIRMFRKEESRSTSFLDIASKVRSGGELGLLGLAFHPDFAKNGFFYVNYTVATPLRTIVSRFRVSKTNPDQADPDSEEVLLSFRQPYANHNGGKVAFGPDGYLYISTGDGGSAGDPQNNGQNKGSLLGKLLRIDVNKAANGLPYSIPEDNPFVKESTTRPEIFAYGLRNPWRFSFDKQTGRIWVGDVGQNALEEIDIVEKGGNYGWRVKEAGECYDPKNNCIEKGMTDPVFQYSHTSGDISVTGGYVYRGKKLPELQGKYIYADYASGRVWALAYENGKPAQNTLLFKLSGTISAFGEDEQQEIYLCAYSDGKILSLADARKQ